MRNTATRPRRTQRETLDNGWIGVWKLSGSGSAPMSRGTCATATASVGTTTQAMREATRRVGCSMYTRFSRRSSTTGTICSGIIVSFAGREASSRLPWTSATGPRISPAICPRGRRSATWTRYANFPPRSVPRDRSLSSRNYTTSRPRLLLPKPLRHPHPRFSAATLRPGSYAANALHCTATSLGQKAPFGTHPSQRSRPSSGLICRLPPTGTRLGGRTRKAATAMRLHGRPRDGEHGT